MKFNSFITENIFGVLQSLADDYPALNGQFEKKKHLFDVTGVVLDQWTAEAFALAYLRWERPSGMPSDVQKSASERIVDYRVDAWPEYERDFVPIQLALLISSISERDAPITLKAWRKIIMTHLDGVYRELSPIDADLLFPNVSPLLPSRSSIDRKRSGMRLIVDRMSGCVASLACVAKRLVGYLPAVMLGVAVGLAVFMEADKFYQDGLWRDDDVIGLLTPDERTTLKRIAVRKVSAVYRNDTAAFPATAESKVYLSINAALWDFEQSTTLGSALRLEPKGDLIVSAGSGLAYYTKNGVLYGFSKGDIREDPENFKAVAKRLVSDAQALSDWLKVETSSIQLNY